ncbi:ribosome biogenesis GTP-binding protein YihA/YsxC [Lapidilactobacillus mulanensis]|uniref:Probable GTP-binding protein EngB n=1 Tax=Lapidilactobacillus mulanensis TaxID=2485999 RepID=A0ABW4DRS3_9LACO|nr:ribosome biogenesis GTP-binding protein YihA/YsxC [Lapidilactobacillus mulanensis]
MKVTDAQMLISAVSDAQYPKAGLPEIVLSGRSNVGKSSLINRLLSRKSLARTSSSPGKTQTLNFYQVNQILNLVDVPGYGYAKVSKTQREKFGQIIEHYLESRKELKGAVILVDARHEPTEDDKAMYHYVDYFDIPILVVSTKIDKISNNQRAGSLKRIRQSLEMPSEEPLQSFSAINGEGSSEIWSWIEHRMKD